MLIQSGSMYINSDGHTIKIKNMGSKNAVYFSNDSSQGVTEDIQKVTKMLELGGYKDITQQISSLFYVQKTDAIGAKKISPDGQYFSEIIKRDKDGVHIKFSDVDKQNSTIYVYDERDFDYSLIFTDELLKELGSKFSNNVFEVIGSYKDGTDLKITVMGRVINKELIEKIEKGYANVSIYQIKRLTNINIK